MLMKKLLLFVSVASLFIVNCTTITVKITSEPSGADIYSGPSEKELIKSKNKTPHLIKHEDISPGFKDWYYQVKKKGYYESNIIFKPSTKKSRYVHFDLKPIVSLQLSVSTTGAAGALKRLTISDLDESRPKLSPDKRWVLVQVSDKSAQGGNKSILEKIDLRSNSKIILTSKSSDSREGDWLPNGNAIVFASDRLKDYTILQSFGTSGATAVRFISNPSLGPARFPCVSPDGNDVAFSVYYSKEKNQICVVEIDGNNLRVYGEGWEPDWSPDGRKIAFTRQVGSFSHIYTMDVTTGVNLVDLSSTEANDFGPSWSPNGKYIAFISDRPGWKHLFIMNSNGQIKNQLTEGYFNLDSVSWGNDGFIYFTVNSGGNLDIWRLKPKI